MGFLHRIARLARNSARVPAVAKDVADRLALANASLQELIELERRQLQELIESERKQLEELIDLQRKQLAAQREIGESIAHRVVLVNDSLKELIELQRSQLVMQRETVEALEAVSATFDRPDMGPKFRTGDADDDQQDTPQKSRANKASGGAPPDYGRVSLSDATPG